MLLLLLLGLLPLARDGGGDRGREHAGPQLGHWHVGPSGHQRRSRGHLWSEEGQMSERAGELSLRAAIGGYCGAYREAQACAAQPQQDALVLSTQPHESGIEHKRGPATKGSNLVNVERAGVKEREAALIAPCAAIHHKGRRRWYWANAAAQTNDKNQSKDRSLPVLCARCRGLLGAPLPPPNERGVPPRSRPERGDAGACAAADETSATRVGTRWGEPSPLP